MKKKIILSAILLIFSFNSFSQAPVIEWQKCLGGTYWDQDNSVLQTSDGGFIVEGYTSSSDGDVIGFRGYQDVWVVKLDFNGNILWKKCYGGTIDDGASCIQQTWDG